jgi:predicted dehydrogenase
MTKRAFPSRRRFLKSAAAAFAAPAFVRAAALGAPGQPPPSDRIAVGCIGTGGRGGYIRQMFLHLSQVVAVCDADTGRREAARAAVERHYAAQAAQGTYRGCQAAADFRELLAREDLDAVAITTPDHWHAPMAVAAARAGKDVFCEKPLSLTLAEGRAVSDAVRRHGRVFQHGTQRRCEAHFARACELVRNGTIGKLTTVRVSSEGSHPVPNQPPMPVPKGFDYGRWLGPAPFVPYTEKRVRTPWWYWIADYTIGFVAGQGVHFTDIAQWGMDADATGPVEIEGRGVIPADGLTDTATEWHVEMAYANGVRLVYDDERAFPMGVIFEGTEGKVFALCGGVRTEPASLLTARPRPGDVRLLRSPGGHIADFVDCIRTRRPTAAPAEAAHRATSLCHLTHIAILAGGRKLRWDPVREQFLGDPAANQLLTKPHRAPWGV